MPLHNDVRVSGGGGWGGGNGDSGWGQKYHPKHSLCNNDSDVNDAAATSIKSTRLQRRLTPTWPPESGEVSRLSLSLSRSENPTSIWSVLTVAGANFVTPSEDIHVLQEETDKRANLT